jgi:hypothetical protein
MCKNKKGRTSTKIVTRIKIQQIQVEWIQKECALLKRHKFLLSTKFLKNWCCHQFCINHNEIKHCHFTNFNFLPQRWLDKFSLGEFGGCQTTRWVRSQSNEPTWLLCKRIVALFLVLITFAYKGFFTWIFL